MREVHGHAKHAGVFLYAGGGSTWFISWLAQHSTYQDHRAQLRHWPAVDNFHTLPGNAFNST